ncbi:hypothetical protein [Candidatus Pristimantibacillus sp. PTI5]|uniref:hypothetical protein n=1 Tax=Candidatus Pristimantibacillus sp. PTI5 TaxID=3400422 RepID=UPI003B02BFA3
MLEIAAKIDARDQGDEGEFYDNIDKSNERHDSWLIAHQLDLLNLNKRTIVEANGWL